jgi:hypothetical protein
MKADKLSSVGEMYLVTLECRHVHTRYKPKSLRWPPATMDCITCRNIDEKIASLKTDLAAMEAQRFR